MKRRAFSLKYGHILGLLDENMPLVKFEESEHPFHVELNFMAQGNYSDISVEDVNNNCTRKITGDKYHLKLGEVVYFGQYVSILMSRLNKHDFKVVIETSEHDQVLFVQKGNYLNRTGHKDSDHEQPYKLYDISGQNQQRW